MEQTERLKEILANYWHLSPEVIDWETQFNSGQLKNFSSLRMLRFLASVEEHFQITIGDVDAIRKFDDLRRVIAV